ncbi:MAG: efflux RND transporter periplasmic adaptor subunit [Gammaproteobacteria bacterium]|nr:efflux RND transporter periplasmic adaptor subunit [Gammaproteobacteria bacterium]MDH3767382.1 efflux RND transporter periplasmic adaptor subunit [Gammaproteobacteria bacterium]
MTRQTETGPAIVYAAALLFATSTATAQAPEMPPSAVQVASVILTEITPTVPVTGTVYSRNELQITTGVDGQLLQVAEPGTVLAVGDVIAAIDTTQLDLQLAEQKAQAERAAAQLRFLNAQLGRQENLARGNSLSANQLEQTQSDRDVANSDLRIAQVRIDQIEDQISRAVIRAPFTGIVVERLRREGEDVSRGTVLARMTDTQNLEVRVFAPLRFAGRVKAGDSLKLFGFESELQGTVRTVVPSADMRSQSFELRIDMPETSDWVIGQLISAAVPMTNSKQSLAMPRDALILRREGAYVFRINSGGRAERVPVETGDSSGDLIAVEGDLQAGDKVVIRGAETLTDGRQVTVLDPPIAESATGG